MEQVNVKQEAQKILADHQIGTLATVKAGKPFSRFMTFFHEDFTLYTATDKDTHKVDDLQQNPDVHILLGYSYEGLADSYLEIEGEASVSDNEELRKKVWNNKLEPWFDGPNDPNYTVLKIEPKKIRLMNTKADNPQVIKF